ncbi:MAG: type II toxin-antitoxin system HicB family antitoxin [Thermoplasmataceae archaeon]
MWYFNLYIEGAERSAYLFYRFEPCKITTQAIRRLYSNRGSTSPANQFSGCISEGDTKEEFIENIKDAISGYIESLKKHGEPIPVEVPIDA